MSFGAVVYTILIRPLQLFFEVVFMIANRMTGNPGLSIIALSLAMNFLVLPLYRRADAMQEEERNMENRLGKGVRHIKKTFKGDERMMILQTYYRQNNYKPTDVFKGSISLFLEIPFFIAAYQFLSHLEALQGVSFGIIADLGAADGILSIAGHPVNLLPIVMTAVNLISCIIFTKGYPVKTKVQLYSMAIFFFFFLYSSPAGLVFYWTLNNVFSLVKTIFYKLKDPKKVLKIMFGVIGAVIIVFAAGFYQTDNLKYKLFTGGIGVVCLCPLLFSALRKHIPFGRKPITLKSDRRIFRTAAIYLIVLTGCVIPSTVIASSPQEFCDVNYFVHPNWFIVSASCFAVGTFAVWMGVFYWLADNAAKAYFEIGMAAVCLIAAADYMLFGNNLGTIRRNLQYIKGISFTVNEQLLNVGAIVLILIFTAVLCRFAKKWIPQLLLVASLAFAVMTGVNINGINSSIAELYDQVEDAETSTPSFTLSKTGTNVIVFMLDRAMNEYFPYIMNEKPELKEAFSGFTYYSNTLAFGHSTNFASAALYGGYEYTPVELNARDTESLAEKQNEALKVMPVLFDENGYDVTVCDPTYANYQWVPDLSIYDDYPDIDTYITLGRFADKDTKEAMVTNNKRNFFCFSITKIAPLFIQNTLYQNGNYNSGASEVSVPVTQHQTNAHVAEGVDMEFDNAYTVLENLSSITEITDEDTNNFLMMSNDTTHEPALLSEPDYTEAEYVDNTAYDEEHSDRFTLNGVELRMTSVVHTMHYQVNMAAMLALADWLEYLKENDVYDNTRIIFCSDHGKETYQIADYVMKKFELEGDDVALEDIESYYPLLLVKDFGSTELTESEEFMTNADVPTLATEGVIDDPVNPFTGKAINSDEKTAHDQYVLGSMSWNTAVNNGNKFSPGVWFSVHDDMRDPDNWELLQKNSTSPFEDVQE